MKESSQKQITALLENDVLARLERLRINSQRRFTNRSRGEHLTGKGGNSTEFSDYRDYTDGDDIRHVDWNIFSRLHRPYLKIYEHEEEMHVVLLIDASSSMQFEEKLDRAKQLAAAFGLMGLWGVEKVSCAVFNAPNKPMDYLPPCTGRASMGKLFRFIESIKGGGEMTLETGAEMLIRQHRGRGIVVVLSDFLTPGDLKRTTNQLYSAGLEIFGIQIFGPSEWAPDVTGDIRFIDAETQGTLDVSSAAGLLDLYHEYREAFQRDLESICRQRSGRFMPINTEDELKFVLFDLMRRKGWVR